MAKQNIYIMFLVAAKGGLPTSYGVNSFYSQTTKNVLTCMELLPLLEINHSKTTRIKNPFLIAW